MTFGIIDLIFTAWDDWDDDRDNRDVEGEGFMSKLTISTSQVSIYGAFQ